LQILASLAALFSDEDLRNKMRQATSSEEIYSLLTGQEIRRNRQAAAPS
jgi:mannitol/fructose-specific phosphotransferase system IIA component (Ntr-type)